MLHHRVSQSLTWVHDHLGHEADWWIIGSTALWLSGFKTRPKDIDILCSGAVAKALVKTCDMQLINSSEQDRFRSQIFDRKAIKGGLDVEIMGDFEVRGPGGWAPLWPVTRQTIDGPWGRVFVPEIDEQVDILRRFGRPKDLRRAEMVVSSKI